jgi:two-component system phosphate regulon sensor histidine kinase PhoR
MGSESFKKYFKLNNQLNKSALYVLISISLILSVFYFSILHLFEDVFLLKPSLSSSFSLLYFLFSVTLIMFFLIFAIGANRMIYVPFQTVIKRIRNLKSSSDFEQLDYFSDLPDFWNDIETEVLSVVEFLKKKNRQSDRIRKAIENILNVFPEPTLVVGKDGVIRYFNKSFVKFFVTQPHPGMTHISDLFREPQMIALVESQEAATTRKEIDIAIQDKKSTFIVFKTPYATRSDEGDYDVLLIFHDITQAKKTEQMKTDFVSNVSHELRTPLMSIQGYIQTLKEDVVNQNHGNLSKYIEIIENHMGRLSNLVSDLLELSYLESDIVLNKSVVNPKDITQRVLEQFHLDLQKGNYKVLTSYEAQDLVGHERLVEQVLVNLIQNSLRHTPQGTQIEVKWLQSPGATELVFKDNGPGISQEHLSRIFERFYRIDPHRSRSRGGTGLGLSIVKHIVQRHGGTIKVQTQMGKGLEFVCTFPKDVS